MIEQRSRKLWVIAGVLSMLLCLPISSVAQNGKHSDKDDDSDNKLVGTWSGTIGTPPNSFSDLMVFNQGGTMTERIANLPKTVSVSSGVWERSGQRNFRAMFEGFIDTDSDGTYDQRFRVRVTIQLVDSNHLTASETVDFLTVDGETHLAGPFPGTPVEATRMIVISE